MLVFIHGKNLVEKRQIAAGLSNAINYKKAPDGNLYTVVVHELFTPLKTAMQALYNLEFSLDHYAKDADDWWLNKRFEFYDKEPQQILIALSAFLVEQTDSTIFARLAIRELKRGKGNVHIYTDYLAGLEVRPLITKFAPKNTIIINIDKETPDKLQELLDSYDNQITMINFPKLDLILRQAFIKGIANKHFGLSLEL